MRIALQVILAMAAMPLISTLAMSQQPDARTCGQLYTAEKHCKFQMRSFVKPACSSGGSGFSADVTAAMIIFDRAATTQLNTFCQQTLERYGRAGSEGQFLELPASSFREIRLVFPQGYCPLNKDSPADVPVWAAVDGGGRHGGHLLGVAAPCESLPRLRSGMSPFGVVSMWVALRFNKGGFRFPAQMTPRMMVNQTAELLRREPERFDVLDADDDILVVRFTQNRSSPLLILQGSTLLRNYQIAVTMAAVGGPAELEQLRQRVRVIVRDTIRVNGDATENFRSYGAGSDGLVSSPATLPE